MNNNTKDRYLCNGNILLLWGYLFLFVTIIDVILLAVTDDIRATWAFVAIPIIGGVATPLMIYRKKQKSKSISYSDNIISDIWILFAVSEIAMTLACLYFAFVYKTNVWVSILLFSGIFFPAAEVFQGYLFREKWTVIFGTLGLFMGITLIIAMIPGFFPYIRDPFAVLFMATMIIPGHITNRGGRDRDQERCGSHRG